MFCRRRGVPDGVSALHLLLMSASTPTAQLIEFVPCHWGLLAESRCVCRATTLSVNLRIEFGREIWRAGSEARRAQMTP